MRFAAVTAGRGKRQDAETMHALYPAYHTLDCTQAILRILEAQGVNF